MGALGALIVGLTQTFIFPGDYGAMDHFMLQNPDFKRGRSNAERLAIALCLIFIALVIAFFIIKKSKTPLKIVFATLVLLSALDLYAIFSNSPKIKNSADSNIDSQIPFENELMSYSKTDKNIVVIVLDMFSGSHLEPLFTQFPELAKNLDGFTHFPNAISTTNSTIHSIATLIAGEHYSTYNMNRRRDNLSQKINEAFATTGLNFANSGFDVSYLHFTLPTTDADIMRLAQNKIFSKFDFSSYKPYYIEKNNLGQELGGVIKSSQYAIINALLSFGLFRAAPEVARGRIYRSGEWFISDVSVVSKISAVGPSAPFYAFTRNGNTDSAKPTFKFIHSGMTHVPYAMYFDGKCNWFSDKTAWDDFPHERQMTYGKDYDDTSGIEPIKKYYYQHYDTEACAMAYLGDYIAWLKERGIYDNTQIFVTSDHSGFDSIGIFKEGSAARPDALFLFKDFGAKGALRTDSRLMANYDIVSIFCENLSGGCPNVPANILEHYPSGRELIYAIPKYWELHKHKKDEWLLDKVYRVRETIYDLKNWVDVSNEYKSGKFVPGEVN